MKLPCGCCAGIEIVTPEPEANRPGLTAIAYRVGNYATFFESMLARLSNLYLDVPTADGSGALRRIYPLHTLTTRDPSDPSIALLDAWAVVGDVLTFYQERIANEGYLGTATERLSILELARLVGYKLRPGVSASVYLAFTVANGFNGTLPSGTRAQSIPGTGEMPQFFETSANLAARDVWNNLRPRLTRPQVITLASNPVTKKPATIDVGTDATTCGTLYFKGISTNLKAGDALLIVSGNGPGQQVLRVVQFVDAQVDQKRTEVTLQEQPPELQTQVSGGSVSRAVATLQTALNPFIADASNIFSGSDLASQVAAILNGPSNPAPNTAPTGLIPEAKALVSTGNATDVANLVQAVIPQIQERHDIAAKRKFTRLEPWIANILDTLTSLVQQLPNLDKRSTTSGAGATAIADTLEPVTSALGSLSGILRQLALPPSLQPANTFRLARSVPQAFATKSDIAPRLLAAFNPVVATTLYQAWGGIETAPSQVEADAVRAKATLFASSYAGQAQLKPPSPNSPGSVSGPAYITTFQAPTILSAWNALIPIDKAGNPGLPTAVALDATYDQIKPGSWIAIDRPQVDPTKLTRQITYHQVQQAQTLSMDTTTGYTAKVTVLLVQPQWLSDDLTNLTNNLTDTTSTTVLRGTVVYAQAEALDLAEEPLDRDVEGNTIELDGLYDGLESGKWIIVSGNRTDITDSTGATNSTGVTGNELVMIAAVTQGPGKQSCRALTISTVPFASVNYVTAPNAAGDLLVVGSPNPGVLEYLKTLPPNPNAPNQQICDPVELAPGLYANAYIPTAAECSGDFGPFTGLLVDPETRLPFVGGQIPAKLRGKVFAWRITNITSGQDTLHTTLVLANSLAYTYDSSTVTIYGNVAKATNGQTVGEVLGNGDGSQSLQKFTLGQSPLTYLAAPTPAGAESTLVVRVNEVKWHEADNLAALGPRDRDYITQINDAQKTSTIFGTGEHGARLPTGTANVKAVYRYGIGKAGNVAAQQISQLATHPLGAQAVINPLRASGGADRDSRDQARRNTPIAVMALDRLVSVSDYAEFARTFAGIGKASATRLSDGRRQVVHVTIAGAEDISIDLNSDLYRNLVQALHQYGDPYQAIQVCVRKVKLLVVSAGVQLLADYAWESVVPKIRTALLDAFSFDSRELGQSAFLSEAVSVMQSVEGVSYVNAQTFDSVAEDIKVGQLAGLAGTLQHKPYPYVRAELARMNTLVDLSTVTDPCQRILPAEMVFLTPDIPDTLILTQIGG